MWDQPFEEMLRTKLPFLPPGEPLAQDTDLRDHGLDSMGIIELLASLESTYQVRFADDLLRLETFATPGVLWSSLATLRAPG
jgi:acyl carrier protein